MRLYAIGWTTESGITICKFGVAQEPSKRLIEIQVGCPFEVAVLHASQDELSRGEAFKAERWLHAKLERFRMRGEWFRICGRSPRPDDAIRRAVDWMKTGRVSNSWPSYYYLHPRR